MKIDIVDDLTIQIKDLYFPGQYPNTSGTEGWYGAPSTDSWQEMLEWARKNNIVCRRDRGTSVVFDRKEDITAFVLRWQ